MDSCWEEDCVTYAKIEPNCLVSLREGDETYNFHLSTLYRHYRSMGKIENPFTKKLLSPSDDRRVRIYGETQIVVVEVNARERLYANAYDTIGDVILQIASEIKRNIVEVSTFSLADRGLYDRLGDELGTVWPEKYGSIQLVDQEIEKEDLDKILEWAKKRGSNNCKALICELHYAQFTDEVEHQQAAEIGEGLTFVEFIAHVLGIDLEAPTIVAEEDLYASFEKAIDDCDIDEGCSISRKDPELLEKAYALPLMLSRVATSNHEREKKMALTRMILLTQYISHDVLQQIHPECFDYIASCNVMCNPRLVSNQLFILKCIFSTIRESNEYGSLEDLPNIVDTIQEPQVKNYIIRNIMR